MSISHTQKAPLFPALFLAYHGNEVLKRDWPRTNRQLQIGKFPRQTLRLPSGGIVQNITFQRISVEQAGMVIAASPLSSPHPASNEEAPQVSGITFRGASPKENATHFFEISLCLSRACLVKSIVV